LWTLGASVQKLNLPPHPPGSVPPDDRVRATRLMPDFHGVFGLWKIDGYRATAKMITDKFRIEGDGAGPTNFIRFPYDWRRSNRESAAALKLVVDQRLREWRTFSHWKDAKVILLAQAWAGWFRGTTLRSLTDGRTAALWSLSARPTGARSTQLAISPTATKGNSLI